VEKLASRTKIESSSSSSSSSCCCCINSEIVSDVLQHCSRLVGHKPASSAVTSGAAAADSVVSTQEALRQHKDWLINFRRDMNLTAGITNVTDQRSSPVQHAIPTK